MVKGITNRKKQYVEVIARFDEEGNMTPLEIKWEDGRTFEIDRVLDARRAASLKVGGIGVRYLCEIASRQTYLFFEDPAWFVEEKVRE
ncbi:MAG: hypothetical protein HGA54_02110 [Actinobacteria bacterium]|nr:hypothetical protein [Actinomycetota bacterium]